MWPACAQRWVGQASLLENQLPQPAIQAGGGARGPATGQGCVSRTPSPALGWRSPPSEHSRVCIPLPRGYAKIHRPVRTPACKCAAAWCFFEPHHPGWSLNGPPGSLVAHLRIYSSSQRPQPATGCYKGRLRFPGHGLLISSDSHLTHLNAHHTHRSPALALGSDSTQLLLIPTRSRSQKTKKGNYPRRRLIFHLLFLSTV